MNRRLELPKMPGFFTPKETLAWCILAAFGGFIAGILVIVEVMEKIG